jgi:hypothetical protein
MTARRRMAEPLKIGCANRNFFVLSRDEEFNGLHWRG